MASNNIKQLRTALRNLNKQKNKLRINGNVDAMLELHSLMNDIRMVQEKLRSSVQYQRA